MSAGRIVLLVFGIIILVGSVLLVFFGGAIVWAHTVFTDDEGFFSTKTIEVERDSYAVVTQPADIDLSAAWIWDWSDLVTFRVEGASDDLSKQVFIGVADESDLGSYLDDVEYDEVDDLRLDPIEIDYRRHPGDSEPLAPTSQGFWAASTYGTGTQALDWTLETGSWSLVLMNSDGSAGLDMDVVLGAKVPWLFGTGIGLLIGGGVGLVVGIVMIYLAVRKA
jgi:hypothetical protein